MRKRRAFPKDGSVVFHCMSHLIPELGCFDLEEKDHFKEMMNQQAGFCGFEVLTYCIMGNHFHLLIRPQLEQELTDSEILRRVQEFYGEEDKNSRRLQKKLEEKGQIPADVRAKLTKRMGDVSTYLKELKGRFSQWYNFRYGRSGPIWTKRFTSTTVENQMKAKLAVAAYIDLNPVRAGIVGFPEDYQWSGFTAALAGDEKAQKGIVSIYGGGEWEVLKGEYRMKIYVVGGKAYQSGKAELGDEKIKRVLEEEGKSTEAEKVKWKIRYFTEGLVLGSKDFVDGIFQKYWKVNCSNREQGAVATDAGIPELEDLWVYKRMREPIVKP